MVSLSLLLASKNNEDDPLIDKKEEEDQSDYGSIERDYYNLDVGFTFEDIHMYVDDINDPNMYSQVSFIVFIR